MSDNGVQLMIVDGVRGYIVNLTTFVLTQIADVDFPNGATAVTFLGGYFIVNNPITGVGRFYWSAPYDGTSWDPLMFATAETDPDQLLWVTQSRGELVLWGTRTIEIWALSQDSQVFRRVGGSQIEWGLAATNSVARFADDLIFLAHNRMGQYCVAVLSGYTVTPVSTPEVEWDLQQRPGVAGASAYSYRWFGHNMYQINFTTNRICMTVRVRHGRRSVAVRRVWCRVVTMARCAGN